MVAIELTLRSIIAAGFCNAHFILCSDNSGVVGAFHAGLSHNAQQNSVLHRIICLLLEHSLWLTTIWVPSKDNLADGPSWGIFPIAPKFMHAAYIPTALCPFMSVI
ncbi:hypothetical protein BD769DRAFT_1359642 [Suillus cothurnatus]|nr:hypothetical protein BD769DRAFT_1359642 [Suillus cothurnatus]